MVLELPTSPKALDKRVPQMCESLLPVCTSEGLLVLLCAVVRNLLKFFGGTVVHEELCDKGRPLRAGRRKGARTAVGVK